MTLSWRFRRELLYSAVGLLFVLVLATVGYRSFFVHISTCQDGIQNQNEHGVDCGGFCSLVCSSEAYSPVVLWSRAFPSGTNTYTAAAYIQNKNTGAGAKEVHYSFQLFDDKNSLILERRGIAQLPPTQTIPIIEPNIDVGNRTVARAFFEFVDTPVWNKVPVGTIPALNISQQNLSQDASRLSATVSNDSLTDISRLTVVAVLFDTQGTAQAASKSVVAFLAHRSSRQVVFTWPQGIPNIVRAEVIVLSSF